jgi:hypothetical protein
MVINMAKKGEWDALPLRTFLTKLAAVVKYLCGFDVPKDVVIVECRATNVFLLSQLRPPGPTASNIPESLGVF